MFRTRAVSSVAVVLIGVVPAVFGVWATAAAFALLGVLALHEFATMFRRLDFRVYWVASAPVVLLALIGAAAGWPAWAFSALVACAVFAPAFPLIFSRSLDGTLTAWLVSTFSTLFVMVPLYHLIRLRAIAGMPVGSGAWLAQLEGAIGQGGAARGLSWFLFALVSVWLTDVGAYLVGRTIGRHPMSPLISPKKTWEGLVGGIAAGVGTALLTNWIFGVGMQTLVAALVGIALTLVATVGDLAESLLKRQTGVKDSGSLIPGHGGVLDRLDSQLFVFVFVYYVALAVG